jgi:hypothetical protein
MKIRIIAILLFAAAAVNAEMKKLALFGDDRMCDLLTVELSNDDNIQLLERNEIDKVLKEHKLSASGLLATKLARLFPHVDIFAVIARDRLVVFNAKNGFRLMDAPVKELKINAENIRMAIKKLAVKNPVYMSVVAVRDIGVPRRYKPKINLTVTKFEQALMQYKHIQMLERSRLGLVNEERELTAKRFPLKTSAQLITLEFEPGSEANIVTLKILINNLQNKIIGRVERSDAFRNIPETVQAVSKDIIKIMNNGNSNLVNRKTEAKRFFSEYLASTSLQVKKTKLSAALALDPMNERFRYEEFMIDGRGWKLHIDRLKRNAKLYPAFRRDFPKSSRRLACYISPQLYQNEFPTASSSQMKWLEAYCDRIRAVHKAAVRRESPFDLSDGIGSMREMSNYSSYIYNTTDITMYWNLKRGHAAYYQGKIKLLQQWDTFLKEFPQYKRRAPRLLRISELKWRRNWKNNHYTLYCEYLNSISDFHAIAEKISLPVAKAESALLKAKIQLLQANSEAECQKIYFEMFNTFYQLDKKFWRSFGLFTTSSFTSYMSRQFRMINYRRFKISYPKNPVADALVLFIKQKNAGEKFSMMQFKELVNSYYPKRNIKIYAEKIAEHVPQIRQLQIQRLKKPQGTFIKLANQIFWQNYRSISNNTIKKILNGLNDAFEIEFIPYTKFSRSRKLERCRGVLRYKNKLYLLLAQKRGIEKMLFVEVDANFNSRIIAKIPKINWIEDFPAFEVSRKNYYIDMNDHYIVIAGRDQLLVINRKTGKQRIHADLWDDWYLKGLALCDDKIYFAASKKRRKIMMKSIAVDGSNQITLFNSHRSEKLSEFDAVKNGNIFIFYRLSNGEIIFRIKESQQLSAKAQRSISDRLVIFDPKNQTFRSRKIAQPARYSITWIKETNGRILLSGRYNTKFLSELNPDTLSLKLIVARDKTLDKYKPEYQLSGYRAATPRYLLDGSDLWCGGETTCYINLSAPERSPMLFISPYALDIEKVNNKIIYFDYMHLISIVKKGISR